MRNPTMTEQDENRRAKDIMTAGRRAGIPISEENARLAAKSSDSLYNAFEVVRSLDLRENRFGIDTEITAKVAAGGWRIWQTGISYTSRNYAEGKKITWKDGIAAFVCIFRYGISVRVRKLGRHA